MGKHGNAGLNAYPFRIYLKVNRFRTFACLSIGSFRPSLWAKAASDRVRSALASRRSWARKLPLSTEPKNSDAATQARSDPEFCVQCCCAAKAGQSIANACIARIGWTACRSACGCADASGQHDTELTSRALDEWAWQRVVNWISSDLESREKRALRIIQRAAARRRVVVSRVFRTFDGGSSI